MTLLDTISTKNNSNDLNFIAYTLSINISKTNPYYQRDHT